MPRVVYSARALDHPERVFEFLAETDPTTALKAGLVIRTAVESLATHPLIGRPRERGLQELIISYGKTGYVALYRYLPEREQVRVLAIRHQREFDYPM